MVPPASIWFKEDQARHQELLRGANADLLVLPVQVNGAGLDRATRSMMTADMVSAFAESTPRLDAHAVQRAFGDGLRKLDAARMDTVASELGAIRRLAVRAGHDTQGNLRVDVAWAERPNRGSYWQPAKTTSLSFPIEAGSPAESFRERAIPAIATFIGVKVSKAPLKKPPVELSRWPADLGRIEQLADSHPFNEALVYLAMGALAPPRPARVREQLHERALSRLRLVDDADWRVRFMVARAHLNLNNRPAAIALLDMRSQPAEKALLALANGNLPALEREVALVKEEAFRLLLETDLQELRHRYRLPVKEPVPAYVARTIPVDSLWRPLIERRLADQDGWRVQSNLDLKSQLDRVLPLEGMELKSLARGQQAIGKDLNPDELGASVFEHLNRLRLTDRKVRACATERGSCARTALLDLVEASAVFNAVKSVERSGLLQASFNTAQEQMRVLEKYLDGQPDYALAVSRVLLESTQRMSPESRSRLLKQQAESAQVAAYWEQGQSVTSRLALVAMGVPSPASLPFLAEYGDDLPPRDYWFSDSMASPAQRAKAAQSRAQRSATNVEPFMELMSSPSLDAAAKTALLRDLEGRFLGHPDRQALMRSLPAEPATNSAAAAKPADARPGEATSADAKLDAEFAAALRERPQDWKTYFTYGKRLIEDRGDYKKAAAVFRQFPGFADGRGYNRVALSNGAYEAGSLLFWRGALDEARLLYKISADLQTGSAASMASAIRLDVLDRRFAEAAAGSLERGSRYDDAYAYRDYLAWLFVLGQADAAWPGFDQLAAKLENPQVWLGAAVGLQKEGRTWPKVREWLLADARRSAIVGGEKPALAAALLMNIVDRQAADDLVQVMKQIEGELTTKFDAFAVTIPHPMGGGRTSVPVSGLAPQRDRPVTESRIDSHLVLFADAYLSLQRGQHAEATEKFYRMAQFYPVEGISFSPNYSYALVYFARAAAKSGDQKGLAAYLNKRNVAYFERFDNHLARAVFSGLQGDHDAAIASLKYAFNNRPYTERRPILTEYQWAETCEWLYEQTRDVRYRDLVLPWLKAHQKIQPMYAWAYAMEAKLSPIEVDRLSALGAALYLDPLSQRAASFPDAVKANAVKAFARNNPFKLRGPGGAAKGAAERRS